MKNLNFFKKILILPIFTILFVSCVGSNDWETPPLNSQNKFNSATVTMGNFIATAPVSGSISLPETGDPIIFDGYVISSDENGNFYKSISIQDLPENPNCGLQVEVDRTSNYADLPIGSHVRIRANGLLLTNEKGVVKLGVSDPTYSVGRIPATLLSRFISGVSTEGKLEIAAIVPLNLPNLAAAKNTKYINTLVKVDNLSFAPKEFGKTYLNYIYGTAVDTDRSILDGFGNSSIIRNSAYFTAGKTKIPEGNGAITFVVSRYNTTWQNIIRNLEDVSIK